MLDLNIKVLLGDRMCAMLKHTRTLIDQPNLMDMVIQEQYLNGSRQAQVRSIAHH